MTHILNQNAYPRVYILHARSVFKVGPQCLERWKTSWFSWPYTGRPIVDPASIARDIPILRDVDPSCSCHVSILPPPPTGTGTSMEQHQIQCEALINKCKQEVSHLVKNGGGCGWKTFMQRRALVYNSPSKQAVAGDHWNALTSDQWVTEYKWCTSSGQSYSLTNTVDICVCLCVCV